jgi:hypothetical protein
LIVVEQSKDESTRLAQVQSEIVKNEEARLACKNSSKRWLQKSSGDVYLSIVRVS